MFGLPEGSSMTHHSPVSSTSKPWTSLFRAFFLMFWVASAAQALDLNVDQDDASCDDSLGTPYCTITAASLDAVDGDRVLVGAGTYFESLKIHEDITVRGMGIGTTVVDGGGSATFRLSSAPTLEQMTITGSGGRGVTLSGSESEARIIDCEITGNFGFGGGGITMLDGSLELLRTTVSNNTSNEFNIAGGAGIWVQAGDLTMIDSFLVNNHNLHSASPGGGMKFNGNEALLIRTTVSGNTSQNNDGGIGGTSSKMTLIDCAVFDNEATGIRGGVGGISMDLTLINTTVSGNRARDHAGVTVKGGSLVLQSSTIYGNEATDAMGTAGVYLSGEYSSSVSNSIIAGNIDPEGAADCFGTLSSAGYNLIEQTDCTLTGELTGNLIGVSPDLQALADNGGATWTHALNATSPALDAAHPATPGSSATACPVHDQRGVPRPEDGDQVVGGRCDIGAYESAATLLVDNFESGDLRAWSSYSL